MKTLCSHWFCRRCIGNALPHHYGKCPSCRQNTAIIYLRSDRLVQNLVNELAVRCHNHKEGCFWTGLSKSRADHEKVCLANKILEVRRRVLELDGVRLVYEKEVANLKAELKMEVEKSVVLSREVQGLKEQVAVDQATIEGLRLLKSPVTDVMHLKGDHSEDAMGGWKKRGVENLTNDTPPKKGFWTPPLVRYVFHPPQVSVLCFSCTKIHDRADQKLFWRGPNIFGRAHSLVSFPPPIRFAPPHITAQIMPRSCWTRMQV